MPSGDDPIDAAAADLAPQTAPPARWSRAWRADAAAQLERRSQAPLTAAAVVMAPVVLAPYALELPARVDAGLTWFAYALWALFALQFAAQMAINPDRAGWLRRHWLDLAVVVVPMIRPMHAARTLRMWWAIAAGARGLVGFRRLLGHRGLVYILGTAAIVVSIAADLVLESEKANPTATIRTFGDALWWSVATVTSVGYGDKYPSTPTGRGIGIALMILGIALFGVVTANLATLFVVSEESRLERQLGDVDQRLRRIEDVLGKQATRQRAVADKAMRVARRTRSRRRSGNKRSGEGGGKQAAAALAMATSTSMSPDAVAASAGSPNGNGNGGKEHRKGTRQSARRPTATAAASAANSAEQPEAAPIPLRAVPPEDTAVAG